MRETLNIAAFLHRETLDFEGYLDTNYSTARVAALS